MAEEVKNILKSNKTIGFIPTMGALHHGHLSLVQKCKKTADICISSIYVNPKQFDNAEDLKKYPNTLEQDCKLLEQNGCDIVFIPTFDEVYPKGAKTAKVDISDIENLFEGKHRKGHFNGVIQVLYQLFDITQPTTAFFGQKDYQQCMVVSLLCQTYFKDLKLTFCPIIREKDGLAMSSRNKRLNKKDRKNATEIYKVLSFIKQNYLKQNTQKLLKKGVEMLNDATFTTEYLAVANRHTLQPQNSIIENESILLVASHIGSVRLIDNMLL